MTRSKLNNLIILMIGITVIIAIGLIIYYVVPISNNNNKLQKENNNNKLQKENNNNNKLQKENNNNNKLQKENNINKLQKENCINQIRLHNNEIKNPSKSMDHIIPDYMNESNQLQGCLDEKKKAVGNNIKLEKFIYNCNKNSNTLDEYTNCFYNKLGDRGPLEIM